MSKKAISFLIAIPALLLLFGYKLIPAFYSLVISMTNYTPERGIAGSQWLGLKNYLAFLNSAGFGRIFNSYLTPNILSIIFTCVLGFVLIICISILPGRTWKIVSIILISIPAFIPAASFADVFMKVFSFNSGFVINILKFFGIRPVNLYAQANLYPFLFTVTDSLRNLYIPVIIGVLACEKRIHVNLRIIFPVLLGYAAARATMLLFPDYENLIVTYNEFAAGKEKVFDIYNFNIGLMKGPDLGLEAAAWVVRISLQLLINIGLYFVFTFLAPRISNIADGIHDKVNRGFDSIAGIIGYLVFAAGSIAVTVTALIPSRGLFNGIRIIFESKLAAMFFANSLLYGICGCIIYGFVTICLAYPLTAQTRVYPLVLILFAALSNNFFGEDVFFKDIGMISTAFPVIISSGVSLIGVFGLYFSIAGKFKDHMPGLGEFLKTAFLPLVTIVMLFFIVDWGSFAYQMLYLNSSKYGVGSVVLQIITSKNFIGPLTKDMQSARSAFIFLSSLIPALLGIILISLEKYLPLSAFVSRIRKQ